MKSFAELVKEGDIAGIRAELQRNPEVLNAPVEGAPSPLLLALYHGQRQVAEVLREFRPKLTLHEAAAMGDLHQIEANLMLDKRGIDAHGPDGFSALGYAAYFGHAEAMRALLDAGAKPNVPSNNPMAVMPLHSAMSGGHKEMARTLIESGADVNAASGEGWTPMHYAAHNGDVETVQYLRQRGVLAGLPNRDGKTPAQLARERGHTGLAEQLG